MHKISRSLLTTYSAEQMYNLVSDIESYSEFLSGCADTRIIYKEGEILEATIMVAKGGLHHSFSTRNRMNPHHSIEMKLLQGPFNHLSGVWTFKPLGNQGCKVSLDLDFEMNNRLTQATLGSLVGQMLNEMVDSFSHRAKQVYG